MKLQACQRTLKSRTNSCQVHISWHVRTTCAQAPRLRNREHEIASAGHREPAHQHTRNETAKAPERHLLFANAANRNAARWGAPLRRSMRRAQRAAHFRHGTRRGRPCAGSPTHVGPRRHQGVGRPPEPDSGPSPVAVSHGGLRRGPVEAAEAGTVRSRFGCFSCPPVARRKSAMACRTSQSWGAGL